MTVAPKIAEPVAQTSANLKKPFFQAKLTVNEPGDAYEQEADAVADRVMRMPDPAAAEANLPFNKVSIASLQRKCASCEDEEKVQRKESEEDEQPVQLKRISDLAIQRQCAACEEEEKVQRKEKIVQREEKDQPSTVQSVALPHLTLPQRPLLNTPRPNYLMPLPALSLNIDWLSINTELHTRRASHLLQPLRGDIEQLWLRNYQLYQTLGLGPQMALWATNKTIATAVGSYVSRDYATQSEIFERGLPPGTLQTPNIPLLWGSFDLGISGSARLYRKEQSIENSSSSVAPPIVSDVISGTGQPLDAHTRQFMESRMGQDFSSVQIHTDGRAAASAQAINALAYTSGKHIVFNSGQYEPNSESGKRLLAHELVHVGQQGNNPLIQRQVQPSPEKSQGILEQAYRSLGRIEEANAILNCQRGIRCEKIISKEEIEKKFEAIVDMSTIEKATDDSFITELLHTAGKVEFKVVLRRVPPLILLQALGADLLQEYKLSIKAQYLRTCGYVVLDDEPAQVCIQGCHYLDRVKTKYWDLDDLFPTEKLDLLGPFPKKLDLPLDFFPVVPIEPTITEQPKEKLEETSEKESKEQERLANEIRDKIFEKVIEARAKDIPYLPSRIPYPYKKGDSWRLNIIVGLKSEESILLLLKRYTTERDSYVQYIFDQMRKKIADIQKSKDEIIVKDDEQKKDKDCGFLPCEIYDFVDVLEDAAEIADEFLGIKDLLDLPVRIKALPECISLFEQLNLFWEFKEHIAEFEIWIKEPQTLVSALIGIESSPLLDNLELWADKHDDKVVAIDKGEEIHGLAAKVKNLLVKIKTLLKPIFVIRKKILGLVDEIQNLVSQVPSLGSIQYLISIAGNTDKLKEGGEEIIDDTVSEFSGEVTYKIKLKIHEIIKLLKLPKIEFNANDTISTKQISRAIAKVASRLMPGVAGKVLRTEPGKLVLSSLTELFLNGTVHEAFGIINSKLNVFNALLVRQLDSSFDIFEMKLVELIAPKIKEKITSKDINVARSSVNNQVIEDNHYLQMLPVILKESDGEQIKKPVLNKLESVINSDFKNVRIHQDKTAGKAASMLHANAFTIGQDIYFGKGKYLPDSVDGQKLLAHELTHVEQQNQGNRVGTIQRSVLDSFGEDVIDAINLIPFVPLPETGFKDAKTHKPLRQKDRQFLRRNMSAPIWADSSIKRTNGWNAHHIIPWEFLHHGVFDVLRANGGWDFNTPDNGIALPTGYVEATKSKRKKMIRHVKPQEASKEAEEVEKLPIHQSTLRHTMGHPVYNEKVKIKLDELLSKYEKDPVKLREEVDKLIEYLRTNELVSAKIQLM